MSIKWNLKYTEMNWNTCFLPLKRFIRRNGENIKHWCLSFPCWFTGKFPASFPGSDSEGSDHRQKLTDGHQYLIVLLSCLLKYSHEPKELPQCGYHLLQARQLVKKNKKIKRKTGSKPPLHFSSSPTSSHSLSLSPWYYVTAYVTQRPHGERGESGQGRRGGYIRNALL